MGTTYCQRCKAKCKVEPLPQSNAKMLKRSYNKGLCVNCAVHDWLRNTYPANIMLAQSGPKALRFLHIQQQFEGIMKVAGSDANFGEIDWDAVVDNWNLPFPTKVKGTGVNPCGQRELDEYASGKRTFFVQPPKPDPLNGKTCITSFEELNLLKPSLGDALRDCLK